MKNTIYLLDANVFIEASRRYYAFDLAPKFWEILIHFFNKGEIESIDRVLEELKRGHDELKDWAENSFSEAFISTDNPKTIESFSKIIEWAHSQPQYSDIAKADFSEGADAWLIAHALTNNLIIVTHEVYSSEIRRKIPIPNVCQSFGINFLDTFEMLRALGVRFQ